jgi:hypothetical protein
MKLSLVTITRNNAGGLARTPASTIGRSASLQMEQTIVDASRATTGSENPAEPLIRRLFGAAVTLNTGRRVARGGRTLSLNWRGGLPPQWSHGLVCTSRDARCHLMEARWPTWQKRDEVRP